MRYLAILKDSLREAWDSWVLLGLLALSTLVILFVASLSFKAQSAQKTMEHFFSPAMFKTLNNRKPEKAIAQMGAHAWGRYGLEKVELRAGDADSPLSTYDVTARSGGRFGVFIHPHEL